MPTLIGIPFDANSSYMRGAAGAPAKIRESMHCDASNMWSEVGVDVGALGAFADRGDLRLRDENAFAAIEQTIDGSLAEGEQPVSVGGDHSITYPILMALGKRYPDLTIVRTRAHLRASWRKGWQKS